jgi:hypothetical protein
MTAHCSLCAIAHRKNEGAADLFGLVTDKATKHYLSEQKTHTRILLIPHISSDFEIAS